MFKIVSQRFSDQNVGFLSVFCVLHGVAINFYAHFSLFFRQWKAGISRG